VLGSYRPGEVFKIRATEQGEGKKKNKGIGDCQRKGQVRKRGIEEKEVE